jgi:2-polyprenyl-3-methyl-5-hydroxy-6-metoxy-1,4-benzoquinol methylase
VARSSSRSSRSRLRSSPLAADCRLCGSPLSETFADLGVSPLANAYLTEDELRRGETFFPLHAFVCGECFLVQLSVFATPDRIFSDYAYFSSFSDSWLDHARRYVEEMTDTLELDGDARVVEVASNDGYLLQYFKQRGVPVLGVEPAANVAATAQERGIPTVVEFFGSEVARRLVDDGHAADVVVANNVLAHVPQLHDFVEGLALLVKPDGVVTIEFPHLLRLIERVEFDTIYHEHFSYFSLLVAERLLGEHGLTVNDVEELPTHGGSLRLHARRDGAASKRVHELLERERAAGLDGIEAYRRFAARVRETKRKLLEFVLAATTDGKSIAGYGAAAKGVTLLNYCGVRSDFIDYIVDRSPHKQGRFFPGTRIPIHDPARVAETRPDFLLLLAWNLKDEIVEQMAHVREFGCRFVVPIPEVEVLP